MAVIILFSNILTSTVFKRLIIVPSPTKKKYHSIVEFLFLLMARSTKEIAVGHSNNALLMFSLLKCKLLKGRGHLKFVSALGSPLAWNTDSDVGGPINNNESTNSNSVTFN